MAQSNPNYFTDDAAVALREVENTAADFLNGMNAGGSCAPGIGISEGQANNADTPEQFTLLDQNSNPRTPQISQSIGVVADVPRTGNQEFTWDRSQALYTDSGAASSGGASGVGVQPTLIATNPTNAAKEGADPSIDGVPIVEGTAELTTLAVGWEAVVIP